VTIRPAPVFASDSSGPRAGWAASGAAATRTCQAPTGLSCWTCKAIGGRHQAVNQRLARALADGFSGAERDQLAAALPLLERLADQL
jgi:hypothetical protein